MTFKVAIDAGHGYNTPGKRTPDGEREWTFNDKVVDAFITELNKYEGVEIKRFDDATGKTDVSLQARTNGANAWGADIYISFHHNANTGKWGNWTGVETFIYTGASAKSKQLANLVHPEIVKAYGLKNRGVRQKNLHIVRETNMPSILIEGGFMDSTIDIKKLRDDNVLRNAGIGTATAVAKFAGLKKKVVAQPVAPNPAPAGQVAGVKAYTIVAGDTFYAISRKTGVSVADLQKFNPRVNPAALKIGDVIYLVAVPAGTPVAKPKPTPAPAPKPAPKPAPAPKAPRLTLPSGVLKKGAKGTAVKQLQVALNEANFKCGTPDGSFGPATFDALKRFQSVHCNPADGVYGPKTRAALARVLGL